MSSSPPYMRTHEGEEERISVREENSFSRTKEKGREKEEEEEK